MALSRMVKPGDRILNRGAPGSMWPDTRLVVDHLNGGIAVCRYADGRLHHGVPATTSFIARFHDGTLNTHMELLEESER